MPNYELNFSDKDYSIVGSITGSNIFGTFIAGEDPTDSNATNDYVRVTVLDVDGDVVALPKTCSIHTNEAIFYSHYIYSEA